MCAALVTVFAALGTTACGSDPSARQPGGLTVVASTDVWGSIASAIAGDHATVDSILTSADADPHSYEATPSDAAAITDATLVVYNGGHYDHWVDDVLAAHPGVKTIDAYALTAPPAAQPPGEPLNEHVFYDLDTAKTVAARIAEQLGADDPSNADSYRSNAAAFGARTDAIAESERQIGLAHPGATVVATEPVAHYLLANAGITDRTPATFASSVEEGDDPSAADVAAMLDLITGREVGAVVVNKQTESPVTTQIQDAARAAGIPIVTVTETLPDGQDYLDWQRRTVEDFSRQLDHAPAAAR